MARLHLVRHAKPAVSWGEDPDPGLDALGITQARATARELVDSLARLPVYTSPMRRCRETADALSELWRCEATIFPAVAEIPSPPLELTARHEWLVTAMRGTWRQLHDTAPDGSVDYLQWRRGVIDSLIAIPHDCVIYSHFIAINVAAGAAQSRDDVLCVGDGDRHRCAADSARATGPRSGNVGAHAAVSRADPAPTIHECAEFQAALRRKTPIIRRSQGR